MSMCAVKCHFVFFFALNIALNHQMKALMNEKCHHWDLNVRKDGFKKVMEDFFLANAKKKIVKVTRFLPGKKKHNRKKKHAS